MVTKCTIFHLTESWFTINYWHCVVVFNYYYFYHHKGKTHCKCCHELLDARLYGYCTGEKKPCCMCQEFNPSCPLINPSFCLRTYNKMEVLTSVQIIDDSSVKSEICKEACNCIFNSHWLLSYLSMIYEMTNQTIPG